MPPDDVRKRSAEMPTAAAWTVSRPSLFRQQCLHFGLCNIVPLFGAAAALAWSLRVGLRATDVAGALAMYLLTTVGIEVGYHRGFAHCAYVARPWLRGGLAVLGAMAGQGPPAYWVAIHRRHHSHADRRGDPHSPRDGMLWSHWLWMLDPRVTDRTRYASDILQDPWVRMSDAAYYGWVTLGLLIPGAAGLLLTSTWQAAVSGVMWGGFMRLVAVQHGVYFINSGCHTLGARPFRLPDRSGNLRLLSLPTLGGSLHNNHHAFPSAPTTALFAGEMDPGGALIRLLSKLRLVAGGQWPSREEVAAKVELHRSRGRARTSEERLP